MDLSESSLGVAKGTPPDLVDADELASCLRTIAGHETRRAKIGGHGDGADRA
jgi:hypothetical protein